MCKNMLYFPHRGVHSAYAPYAPCHMHLVRLRHCRVALDRIRLVEHPNFESYCTGQLGVLVRNLKTMTVVYWANVSVGSGARLSRINAPLYLRT